MADIEGEAAGADDIRREAGGPPQHRAQTREQFLDRERLCQIVVRAAVEPGDTVGELAAGRQDDDGTPSARALSLGIRARPSPSGSWR